MMCPEKSQQFDSHAGCYSSVECDEKQCAEWDEQKFCCGRRTERLQLERIANALMNIASKIPLGGVQ